MAESSEARGHIEADELTSTPAGKPGPQTVRVLLGRQPVKRGREFVIQSGGVEKLAHPAACGVFIGSLSHPRGFLDQQGHQCRVLFEGAFESRSVLPEIEDVPDLWIRKGEVPGQRVRVVTVEDLFAALVGKLHQVRQSHDGVPRGL